MFLNFISGNTSEVGGGRLCHIYDMVQGSQVQFLGRSITLAMIAESAECTRRPLRPRRHCVSRVVKTQTVVPSSEGVAKR